jgi:HK97 family phage prohead protease
MAVSDKPWSQFSESDYTPEQWRRACLIDTGNGVPDAKGRYKLPVREPDGTLNRNGVHAAAGGHGVDAVQGISADKRRAAAKALMGLYKEVGDEPPPSLMMAAGMTMSGGRSEEPSPWSDMIVRSMQLDDLEIKRGAFSCERCGKDATGRMVDAYATVFNSSAEIADQHGHYHEVIDSAAFNMVLGRAKDMRNIGVYYHHGMTLHGTPSGEGAFPLGHPSAVRSDRHGLFTSTHYSTNDVGERALQLIKEGTLTGMSFQGRIYRSDPQRIPAQRRGGPLPTVRRLQLGLREYGPTPSPAYAEAQVAAVRAAMYDPSGQLSAGHAGTGPPFPSDMADGAEDMREALSRRQRILRLRAEEHFRRALING